MATIDIRDNDKDEITEIKFADGNNAICVEKYGENIALKDLHDTWDACVSRNDIDNLIKALQKAKELWG